MYEKCGKNLVLIAVLVAATAFLDGSAVGQKVLPMPMPPENMQKEYFHIEGCGILKGHMLTANGQTWELFLKNDRLQKTAAELDGKCTFVTGTPEFRRHPSRGTIPTIVVDQLRAGKPMQPMGN